MPKTIYACEKCGSQFGDYAECTKHEQIDHATISFYGDFEVIHNSHFSFYPEEILVPFTDGAVTKYRAIETVKPVDRKESPLDSGESKED
jgi:hypothetical protein